MAHEEIKEGNALIIEFMGGTHRVSERYGDVFRIPDKAGEYGEKAQPIHYHTSWDWLMPVVEKIRKHGCDFTIAGRYSSVQKGGMYPIIIMDKQDSLQNTYKAVIEFIKWYHSQRRIEK